MLSLQAKELIQTNPKIVDGLKDIYFENAHLIAEIIIDKKSVELATALQRELASQLGIECKEEVA